MPKPYLRTCDLCLKQKRIIPSRDTGWQWFVNFVTALGNIYSGRFCPECTRKVEAESE